MSKAADISEEIERLEEELRLTPKNKATEKAVKMLNARIAELRREMQKAKKKGPARLRGIKKVGDAQAVLMGPKDLRDELLSSLTSARSGASVGMLLHNGAQIQLLNFSDDSETKSAVLTSDLVVAWQDSDIDRHRDTIQKAGREVLFLKEGEDRKSQIWRALGLIRVYTKKPGKQADLKEPLILRRGDTVQEICEKLRLDAKDFLFARIWGKSARFEGQRVSLHHRLQDEDIVELNLKK